MNNNQNKTYLTIDLGPTTLIFLAEMILIVLKLTGHINVSWILALSPIIVLVGGAAIILFLTLIKLIKRHIF